MSGDGPNEDRAADEQLPLLRHSTGLWWVDPLTDSLIVEVQTVQGIRQVIRPRPRVDPYSWDRGV